MCGSHATTRPLPAMILFPSISYLDPHSLSFTAGMSAQSAVPAPDTLLFLPDILPQACVSPSLWPNLACLHQAPLSLTLKALPLRSDVKLEPRASATLTPRGPQPPSLPQPALQHHPLPLKELGEQWGHDWRGGKPPCQHRA